MAAARARVSTALWSLVARVRLRAHGASIGRGLRVRGPLRLHCHRTARIRLGDHCRIQSGFAGNPVGGNGRMSFWVGPGATLTLGDRVGLSNSTIVCLQSVTLEDDVFLGGDSKIYDTDFHSLDPAERLRPGNPGSRTAPVAIHRRAFVGGHSILLKGATVGEAAVVGAGSVVRGAVPALQIWAGNPARFLAHLPASGTRSLAVASRGGRR
jgi:acetyltransferase-like isoleucine patch superfamily enzyme